MYYLVEITFWNSLKHESCIEKYFNIKIMHFQVRNLSIFYGIQFILQLEQLGEQCADFYINRKWIFDFNIYILRITAVFGFMYVVGELLEDQLLQKIVCLFIYVLRNRLLLHLLNSFHRYIFGHAGPSSSPTLQKCTCYQNQSNERCFKMPKKAIFCNFCDRHFIQNCAFQRQTDQRFCI